MKQQILFIGGGNSFINYDYYLSSLKNQEITLDRIKSNRGWRNSIGEELGNKYEFFSPEMPNRLNAKYMEWKIVFEKVLPLLNNGLLLIGHSLGGIFLAKYLSENNIFNKISGLILISAPFDEEGKEGESLNDFKLNLSISGLNKYKKVVLIHSKDDKTVSFSEVKKYLEFLPKAELVIFEDKGHFKQDHFPELVEIIKKLAIIK